MEKPKQFVFRMPPALAHKFQVRCVTQGIGYGEQIVRLIEQWLKSK